MTKPDELDARPPMTWLTTALSLSAPSRPFTTTAPVQSPAGPRSTEVAEPLAGTGRVLVPAIVPSSLK
jgi:hypothetical protein